jgi:hypothetical protein
VIVGFPGIAWGIEVWAAVARQLFRGVLGLILAAAATWLAAEITQRVFGLEDDDA